MDFDITTKLQDHIPRKFDFPFSLFSILGSVEITAIFWFILSIFALIKRYWLTFIALFSFWFAHFLEIFGKVFVLHPGPPHLFYRGTVDLNFPSHFVQTDFSYPSGHMMRTTYLVTFIILFIFYKIKSPLKLPIILGLIAFTFLMMVSRIYLAEHWTTDVVGGILLGISLGVFTSIWIPKKLN